MHRPVHVGAVACTSAAVGEFRLGVVDLKSGVLDAVLLVEHPLDGQPHGVAVCAGRDKNMRGEGGIAMTPATVVAMKANKSLRMFWLFRECRCSVGIRDQAGDRRCDEGPIRVPASAVRTTV